MIIRTLTIAAVAALFAAAAVPPAEASEQLRRSVARDLPGFGFGKVDVRTLSGAQLAAIYQIMYSDKSETNKRLLIASTLGGRHSLRGLILR